MKSRIKTLERTGLERALPSRATVVSVYFPNVDQSVAFYQKQVMYYLLPYGWQFKQLYHQPAAGDYAPHATAIQQALKELHDQVVIILDIDCVPVVREALEFLYDGAMAGELVGCVQRANHLQNGAHLYVGPFCMAFDQRVYEDLNRPSFAHTAYGDTGEELTYAWEENRRPVRFLWPTSCRKPMWELDGSCRFGLGTTYGSLFYHQFAIREGGGKQQFIDKCKSIMEGVKQ